MSSDVFVFEESLNWAKFLKEWRELKIFKRFPNFIESPGVCSPITSNILHTCNVHRDKRRISSTVLAGSINFTLDVTST